MSGQAFRRPTCEHCGEYLDTGTVGSFITWANAEPLGTVGQSLLELVHHLRGSHIGINGTIRICPDCLCVTLPGGEHADMSAPPRRSH